MRKRSAVTKLHIILLIDLLVVSLAAAAYFQIQPQLSQTSGGLKPAEFTVTNLQVTPSQIAAGNTASVSANITNIGDVVGTFAYALQLDGQVVGNSSVTLAGGESVIVSLPVTESNPGTYTLMLGNVTSTLTVGQQTQNDPTNPSWVIFKDLVISPVEPWPNTPFSVSCTATNTASQAIPVTVFVKVDGVMKDEKNVTIPAGMSLPIAFNVQAETEGVHSVQLNYLSGGINVAPTGEHTLTINAYGSTAVTADFTIDGVAYKTPVNGFFSVGYHTIVMPPTDPTGAYPFLRWEDYSKNPTRTIDLQDRMDLNAYYAGGSSCPSLYYWNGEEYVYVAEVSNGGWLGYIGYMTQDGDIVFLGGNPWDHAKIDPTQLQTKQVNGSNYYDYVLYQRWNEIFYLDTAYMLVVDHPAGTDAYASLANYMNPNYSDTIYTVNTNDLRSPVSAVNEYGQSMLSQISALDGVFTTATSGTDSPSWNNIHWNQLTLDLGDLSAAQQIKLVINGIVDWGSADQYYAWINQFKEAAAQGLVANGTEITPPPFMEVKDASGNWVPVSADMNLPIPADYVARTFAVNITGIFPAGVTDYQIRINNFWNVTYDYIGVDTSNQAATTIQKLSATATLSSTFDSPSAASGNFTKLGDVTPLLLNLDNMFVIGRQGDKVELLFPADNLAPVADGMVRDYFIFDADWFKDAPDNWGYEYNLTVDPLPFTGMSGFPYPSTESYPYDAAHVAYLNEWNTRKIEYTPVNSGFDMGAFSESLKIVAVTGLALAGIFTIQIWKKNHNANSYKIQL